MSLGERWFPGHLTELTTAECLEQLAVGEVGRVAVCDDSGPLVVPVNYALDDGGLLLRLAAQSGLARSLRSGPASFEIDDVDAYTQTGWSVLVRGHASYVDPTDRPAADDLLPWPEGQRTQYVRIEAQEITGRRLLPA